MQGPPCTQHFLEMHRFCRSAPPVHLACRVTIHLRLALDLRIFNMLSSFLHTGLSPSSQTGSQRPCKVYVAWCVILEWFLSPPVISSIPGLPREGTYKAKIRQAGAGAPGPASAGADVLRAGVPASELSETSALQGSLSRLGAVDGNLTQPRMA